MSMRDQWESEKASDWVVTPPDGESHNDGKPDIKISEESWDPADWTPEQKIAHAAFDMAMRDELADEERDALCDALVADDIGKAGDLLLELYKKYS